MWDEMRHKREFVWGGWGVSVGWPGCEWGRGCVMWDGMRQKCVRVRGLDGMWVARLSVGCGCVMWDGMRHKCEFVWDG